MQRFHLVTGCAIALALAGVLGACDDGPTRPSTPIEPPTVVTVIRLEIAGPGTVPPGESAQYSAIAHQSDGSTRNVTNEAQWQSGNPSVLSISATGLATGRERGETWISVSASGMRATKNDVVVVPAGTYRLTGTVQDSGFPAFGATVHVTAGTGQGLEAVANPWYRLYGVAGDIEVRAIASGYEDQRKSLRVTSHQTLDFELILSRPRRVVSGTYTLTVTTAPECRAALPAEAGIRTYTAVVGQAGPLLTVTLEGSKFFANGGRTFNSFDGTVEPSRVTFRLDGLDDYYYYYVPDVIEQLTDTTLLLVSGGVTIFSSAGLSGTLAGAIATLQSTPPGGFREIASCRSNGHQFVLTER